MKPAAGIMKAAFARSAVTQVTLLVPQTRSGRLQATARTVFVPALVFKCVWIRRRAELAHGTGGERQGYEDLIQFLMPPNGGSTLPEQGHRIVRGLYLVDDEWPAADEWEIVSPPEHLSEYDAFHVIQLRLRKLQRGGQING